jgi:hypothetical protein
VPIAKPKKHAGWPQWSEFSTAALLVDVLKGLDVEDWLLDLCKTIKSLPSQTVGHSKLPDQQHTELNVPTDHE